MAQMPQAGLGGVQGVDFGGVESALRERKNAQREVAATIGDGLTALTHAIVQTESQRASADLAIGLEKTKAELEKNKAKNVSTQFLREQLGDDAVDRLPPELRSLVFIELPNGERQERDDIPMWQVAGILYDAQAQKLLDESSKKISIKGWRTKFQDGVREHVAQTKARLNGTMVEQADQWNRAENTKIALEYANAGMHSIAMNTVANTFDPNDPYRVKLEEELVKIKENKVVYDALNSEDPTKMREMMDHLKGTNPIPGIDPFEKMTSQEKASFISMLDASRDELQNEARTAADRAQKRYDEDSWKEINDTVSRGGSPRFSMIKQGISEDIHRAQNDYIIRYNEARRAGLKDIPVDWKVYQELRNMATNDPEGFKKIDLATSRFKGQDGKVRALPAYMPFGTFKELVELQLDAKQNGLSGRYGKLVKIEERVAAALPPGITAEKDQKQELFYREAIMMELERQKPKSIAEEDRVIKETVAALRNSNEGKWAAAETPLYTVGVPAAEAGSFYGMVRALGEDPRDPKVVKELHDHYTHFEPMIEEAWANSIAAQYGMTLTPDLAQKIWAYAKHNEARLGTAYEGFSPTMAVEAITDAEKAMKRQSEERRFVGTAVHEFLNQMGVR